MIDTPYVNIDIAKKAVYHLNAHFFHEKPPPPYNFDLLDTRFFYISLVILHSFSCILATDSVSSSSSRGLMSFCHKAALWAPANKPLLRYTLITDFHHEGW